MCLPTWIAEGHVQDVQCSVVLFGHGSTRRRVRMQDMAARVPSMAGAVLAVSATSAQVVRAAQQQTRATGMTRGARKACSQGVGCYPVGSEGV